MRHRTRESTIKSSQAAYFSPVSWFRKWSPVLLISIPWPIMLLLYHVGPIEYRSLSASTWFYLAAILLSTITGYQLGWNTSNLEPNAFRQERSLPDKTFRVLVLIGTVGSIIWLLDALRSGYSFEMAFSDPVQGRILQEEHVTSILTTLSFPFAVFSYSAFFFALMRIESHKRDRWTLVGLVAVTPIMLVNILQAGRQTFFIMAILLASWSLLHYGHRSLRNIVAVFIRRLWIILPVVLTVLSYFVFIAATRHKGGSISLDLWLALGGLNTRSTYGWENSISPELVIGAYSGIYYYTHQLSALDAIIAARIPGAGFGRGILAWIFLQLRRTGLDLTFDDLALKGALVSYGENLWGWITGFGTLISDFGVVGSVIFIFLFAIMLSRLVKSAILYRSHVDMLAATWFMAACLMMIQFFPGDGIFILNVTLMLFLRRRLQRASVSNQAARSIPVYPQYDGKVPRA